MGSTDLSAAQSVGSLQGEVLGIAKTSDGRVFINGATKVILADVVANNGVVHVIDEVLLPPSVVDVGAVIDDAQRSVPSIVETAVNTPILSTLVSVLTTPAYEPVL